MSGNIVALHYSNKKMSEPDEIIKGKTADAIYTKISELGLAQQPLTWPILEVN